MLVLHYYNYNLLFLCVFCKPFNIQRSPHFHNSHAIPHKPLLPVVKEKVSTFDYETPNMMFGVWHTAHQFEMSDSKIKIS